MRPTTPESFWGNVEKTEACWVWRGSVATHGYGQCKVRGKNRRAHRLAYELTVGPIPDGLTLDHLCRNKLCVNPDHLEPVTQAENNRRGMSPSACRARQTHCKNGHEFTPENTYVPPSGCRHCRECARARGK